MVHLYLTVHVNLAQASSSVEPLLFENIGQMVSGLSYVHTHIPINITEVEIRLQQYSTNIMREFSEENLQATYKAYLETVLNGPTPVRDKTLSKENLQYLNSKLALWPQIASIHQAEITQLQTRINTLFLTLPKPEHQSATNEFPVLTEDPYSPDKLIQLPNVGKLPKLRVPHTPRTTPKPINTTTTRSRPKRLVPLIIAGIGSAVGAATAGTAFGIVTKHSLETLAQKVNDLQTKNEQILQVFQDVQLDLQDNSRETKELIISTFMDRTFDSGIVLAKLRSQLSLIANQVTKIENVVQQAQQHRLSTSYLSPKHLLELFQQVQMSAKRFGYRTVIERPSELFQLDASYTFDGHTLSLLLHVPIAPPEAFMRLYKLHPFPLPFDNGTLLTHNVKNEILAISNSNLRYTIQMSTVDLIGCHQLGKTFLCPRNGLLNKYPEDSCLGSLYHQKFEIAHQLCDFKVEPAKEFIYQLLNNWFMVYEPAAITIPVTCSNGSHSELHVRRGISKFHLTAGCSADFPRYKLLSDISVLIPQDYIQLEMDWDPVAFMPGVREFLLPEIDKLNRMGATMTSLATLQSMVASRLEDVNPMFHFIHFGFNSVTILLASIIVFFICYRVYTVYQARQRRTRAQQLDLAVRTVLNRNPSVPNLPAYPPDGNLNPDLFDTASIISIPRNQNNRLSYRQNSVHYEPPEHDTHTLPLNR
jgi:hypothetical protein